MNIYHEGDERSRTNPGHGYPAYTETINTIEYKVFSAPQEMHDWVVKAETSREKIDYQLIQATPLSVKLNSSVAITRAI